MYTCFVVGIKFLDLLQSSCANNYYNFSREHGGSMASSAHSVMGLLFHIVAVGARFWPAP